MIFQNRLKNGKAMIPAGTICLVIAILWPMFFHPATDTGRNLSDGIRGALFGFSIGINLFSLRLASRCSRN
jgi:hypothetical protein